MSVIKELVRNILLYYILVSVTMSLIGKSSFKKYIEMFTGLVLILIIITPVFKFLKLDNKLELNIAKNQLYEVSEQESQDIMLAELTQDDIIAEQYKNFIQKQIKEDMEKDSLYASEIEVEIEDSIESKDFGQIKSVAVICSKGKKDKETEDDGRDGSIETIEIPKVQIEEREKTKKLVKESVETDKAKEQLAETYGLSEDQISISLEED